jgi:hypothetical protein
MVVIIERKEKFVGIGNETRERQVGQFTDEEDVNLFNDDEQLRQTV